MTISAGSKVFVSTVGS